MKGTIRRILVMAMVCVMIFAVGCQKGETITKENAVAKVGDKFISKDEYNKRFELFKQASGYDEKAWTEDVDGKSLLQIKQEQLLDSLVQERMIVEYLKKEKVKIDQKEVDELYKNFMKNIEEQKEVKAQWKELGIDEKYVKEQMIEVMLYMQKFEEEIMKEVDKKSKAYYDENKDEYLKDKIRASHILVEKEETAKDILKKINAGEDFSELAKEHSTGPSGPNGGDLGIFGKGQMVPEFEKASFALKIGEVSEPVKTQFGYHIIKRTEPTYKAAEKDIAPMFMGEVYEKKMEEMEKDIKIEKYIENIK